MDFNKLYEETIRHKNEEQARQMSKYMLNKFEYIGIKTPERREIFKNFSRNTRMKKKSTGKFVNKCWKNKYREFSMLQLIIKKYEDKLTIDDIPKFNG